MQDYSRHIDSLRAEMDEATESAREIRAEIHAFRHRSAVVRSQDKCSACQYPLLLRAFYVFPCQHRFHADCLLTELLPHLPASVRSRATELQRRITSDATGGTQQGSATLQGGLHQTAATLASVPGAGEPSSLKSELDDLVASECVYCGDVMIRMVDKPFISDQDYDTVVRSWL